MSTLYVPMVYDDKGEPTVPDWNYEGERTPEAAATEEWEQRRTLCDSGSILVAKVEDTTEVPPESEQEALQQACEYTWKPGDPWRKWLGCVEVRIVSREVPKP